MTLYEVTVRFVAEDEVYGTETYYVQAENEHLADTHATKLSEDSLYFDPRIDFRREVEVEDSAYAVDDVPAGVVVHQAPEEARMLGV